MNKGSSSLSDMKLLLKAFAFIKPHKYRFIASMLFKIISLVIITFQPLLFGQVIDNISKRNTEAVGRNIIFMLIIFLSSTIFGFLNRNLTNHLAVKVESDVRKSVFKYLLDMPIQSFDSVSKGGLIVKLDEDVRVFTDLLINKLAIIIDIGSIFVVGAILLRISPVLTLILLMIFPVSFIIYLYYGKKIKNTERTLKEKRDNYFTFIQETLSGFKTIKVYEAERIMKNRYASALNNIYNQFIRKMFLNNLSSTLSQLANYGGYLLILSLGAWQIGQGHLTLGRLVAFNTYSSGFNGSLMRISQLNSQLQETMVSLQRIFKFMEDSDNIINKENRDRLCDDSINIDFSKNIELKNISFKYKDDDIQILNNISVIFPRKKMTAIMGFSGSGKTTMINLLSGLYRSYEGNIVVENTEYRSVSVKKIIENIAFVTQENFFFSGTIKENLLFSKPEASFEDVVEACKMVYIHDYIMSLPNKYDTYLGSNGIDLSIGQKQRLSIARALLKKPSVYLFDEITSSLDGQSEKYIAAVMKELSKSYTVIAISHRISSVNEADQFVLVNKGEVAGIFNDKKQLMDSAYFNTLMNERISK